MPPCQGGCLKNVLVDFESYYDNEVSVDAVGLQNYTRLADAYLVGVLADGLQFCGAPAELARKHGDAWMSDPQLQFWAFNSNFDQRFWEKYFPRTARPWKCISDLASFSQLPRNLQKVAEIHLHKTVDKKIRDRMKGVRFESLPPKEQREVTEYCFNDVVVEKELLDKLPPMTLIEDEIAEHTRMLNRRGTRIDLERVEADTEALHRLRFNAYEALPWTSFCETPLSHARFAEYCQYKGAIAPKSLDKRDEQCERWMVGHPELAPLVRHMRTYRGANTKLKKLKLLQANVTEEGVLPLELLYCGARHTRRWSSVGFNVQNLDKEAAFTDEMSVWSEFASDAAADPGIFMRAYLVPPPGCKFGIIDFEQIEPRCLNWLVGNDELLAAIRAGYSYYEAYARIYKKWAGEPGKLKQAFPGDKYTKLKNEAIGLGYGMGAAKYTTYARVSPEEAAQVVKDFRSGNPKIKNFWRQMDQLIRAVAEARERTLTIEMPTGDVLRQFHVRCKDQGSYESFSIRGDFGQMSRQSNLWGGVLTENVTQRMARDVLAVAILRLEKAGFPVIFHAHDEIIIALAEGTAQKDFEEARRIMSVPPDWCPDLPLGAGGSIHDHYTKI